MSLLHQPLPGSPASAPRGAASEPREGAWEPRGAASEPRGAASAYVEGSWRQHPAGFEYAWRGWDLFYRRPGAVYRVWQPGSDKESVSPPAMLAFPGDVGRFVRASMLEPDAHTRVLFDGGDRITVVHKGPAFPEVAVALQGGACEREGYSPEAASEVEALKGVVRRLEARLAVVEFKLNCALADDGKPPDIKFLPPSPAEEDNVFGDWFDKHFEASADQGDYVQISEIHNYLQQSRSEHLVKDPKKRKALFETCLKSKGYEVHRKKRLLGDPNQKRRIALGVKFVSRSAEEWCIVQHQV